MGVRTRRHLLSPAGILQVDSAVDPLTLMQHRFSVSFEMDHDIQILMPHFLFFYLPSYDDKRSHGSGGSLFSAISSVSLTANLLRENIPVEMRYPTCIRKPVQKESEKGEGVE